MLLSLVAGAAALGDYPTADAPVAPLAAHRALPAAGDRLGEDSR